MFLGEFECKMDKKNRLFIPASFRKNINEVVITFIDEDTIVVMNAKEWNPLAIIENAQLNKKRINLLTTYIKQNSYICKVDSQGRITIPINVISRLSFNESMVVGNINSFLILNKEKYLIEKQKLNKEFNEFLENQEGEYFKRSLIYRK